MAQNQAPTEEEIDEFMELYDDLGSIKAVAEEVDWSRPTVSKWIRRREEQEEEDDDQEEAEAEDNPHEDPEGDYTANDPGTVVPENLIEEPESPNEILLDIIERDPKLGEDEATYIKQFFADYGQLSPSDVTSILQDLSINNKRMTISRITRHYEKAINRRLRENRDLMYDERWATLLTKVTGDNSYIREAQSVEPERDGIGGIQPPRAGESSLPRGVGDQSGITPPQPPAHGSGRNGQSANGQMGGHPTPPPQQSQPQQPPAPGQSGGQQGLDPFQQRVLELLEEKLNDDPTTPQTTEPESPTEQIQELLKLQEQMEQLQPGDGGGEIAEQLSAVVSQMEKRMERLEQQIQQSGGVPEDAMPQKDEGSGGDSMLAEIAMLAERVDDPEMLSMLIETQTDPEVLKARAQSKEVENETEWKKSLAESMSPAAAEKAIDAFLNLTSGISQQGIGQQPAQQPQQAQPRQAQPPQEPQQPARDVAVVENQNDGARQARKVDTPDAQPEEDEGTQSPLREEGERALSEEDDGEDETEGTETDTAEEDNE